ncbi:hypothetical protein PIB30_069805 [Stylosanthes scabra]|uniref:Uncharacterized protein n=1 Tax=Stylosanthes scabra TaxID=79078 RepID=A0ABU6ZLY4_9FABA|nr:hypothetical protein [Stylosanthes scabra]
MQGNRDKQAIDFDPKIERTLRISKKKAKQQVVNQVIEEVEQNKIDAVHGNEQRRTLGDYTIPSTASCCSSFVRPNVEAKNFELKPSLREFRRTSKIPEEKLITAKQMESTRIPRSPNFESQCHHDLKRNEEYLSSMQFLQQCFYENMQKSQSEYMEEVKQIKTLVNNQRAEAEKVLQQAAEKQQEKHTLANPNLSEILVNHIPDLLQTNAERGRPMFYGALSHIKGQASSQPDQQEPVPLQTAPPIPGYQPPCPPPN